LLSWRLACKGGEEERGYQTIAGVTRAELEAKKSKFVAIAAPVRTPDEAMEFLRGEADAAASHNCFAYKIGWEQRSSDDGEPSGTAGRPILSSIEQEQLDGVCVVVTRYFGGVKLGTGGLVRAYGQSARECLKLADRVEVKPMLRRQLAVGFEDIGPVFSFLDASQDLLRRVREDAYVDEGVVVTVEMGVEAAGEVDDHLKQVTRGRVFLRDLGESK